MAFVMATSPQRGAGSPGPAYSESGTPTRRGGGSFLAGFMKRAESPASSLGGGGPASEAGTPGGKRWPSFSSGQRKREVIAQLQQELGMLNMQLHTRDAQLAKLQAQAAGEAAARAEAQEALNMQYFKANLVTDMLVARLLELEASPARPPAAQQEQQQPAQQQTSAAPGAGASVLREASFD